MAVRGSLREGIECLSLSYLCCSLRLETTAQINPSEKKLATEVDDPDAKPAKPKRVGRCTATFHVTPKSHHKAKKLRGTKKA